ncbi:NfeD-like partner-binding protein [Scopulibacillus darangshiensis]|uniref:NfeD-like partner-binding protein n=1 Tax=Scopulibacillus darangshiensis TaxID=442528 RepID=A0A4R2P835_9BACL|nr:NfeD family protein [Scopulibacillus darangshiensis]TCP31129.1 NfeD-like partner-binding protein [Scopulibacillus darangshiensis]
MGILDLPVVGFIVILLAALLLFGEMIVKTKGVFALIGGVLFLLYFSHHLSHKSPALMIVLLAVGLLLIILDGKLITNGSVAAIGIVLMILACALPTPSVLYGTMVSIAFIIGVAGSFSFLKVFPARGYWSKLTLVDQLSSEQGYNSMNASYQDLIGQDGVTATPFRPVGTVEIEGKTYSAVTNGIWLEKGTAVKVVSADGTRIVIEKEADV